MGGLTIEKIFVILVIALIIVGPDKLPRYAQKLGELVRGAKRMADGAKDRLREEMGPEFDDVDWKQLDPRQYDPRRIIRDALLEDEREAQAEARKTRAAEASRVRRERQKMDSGGEGGAGLAAAAVAAAAAANPVGGGALSDAEALQHEEFAPKFDDEAT